MARRGGSGFVDWRRAGPWFAIAVGVFYLNDVAFLNASGYRAWLTIDYATRLLVLGVFVVPASVRAPLRAELRVVPRLLPFVALALGATICGIATEAPRLLVSAALPELDGVSFPAPDSTILHGFDLTVGIALVAVTEELAFRGPLLLLVRSGRVRPVLGLVVSSLVFAGMHWSSGLDNVVASGLAGAAFGAVALVARSLWPAIVAHYLVDVWNFL